MHAVKAPAWKWEWNLNTLVILVGFVGGFMTWGATWNELQNRSTANAQSIDRLDSRLTVVETSMRVLDTQALRIASVEKQASDASISMRSLETTLNALGTDIRVVKEILQRLENGNSRPQQQPTR
ncbi:MAG: hypothetical protein ACK4QP_05575 [Pseudorhizobium sp.]